MTTILVDHDMEGQALVIWGVLGQQGWLEITDLHLVTFKDVGLPFNSNDREVWHFAQAKGMILLTNNRNMVGEDSLEQTLRDDNKPTSIPILTIGNKERLSEKLYRDRCAAQLLEIALEVEKHLGRGRIYIP